MKSGSSIGSPAKGWPGGVTRYSAHQAASASTIASASASGSIGSASGSGASEGHLTAPATWRCSPLPGAFGRDNVRPVWLLAWLLPGGRGYKTARKDCLIPPTLLRPRRRKSGRVPNGCTKQAYYFAPRALLRSLPCAQSCPAVRATIQGLPLL